MNKQLRQPRRRMRLAFSCVDCRRRKIKCDRSDPCRHCVSAKLQCIYKTFPREVPRQESEDGSSPLNLRNGGGTPAAALQPSPAIAVEEHSTQQVIAELLERVEKLEKSQASKTDENTTQGHFQRKAADYDAQMTMDKTRVLRWSHWMGAGETVSHPNAQNDLLISC